MTEEQRRALIGVLAEKRALALDEGRFMGMVAAEFGEMSEEDGSVVEQGIALALAERG